MDAAPDRAVAPLDALRSMREELWDDERRMDRYAPGVVPGIDISSLNLHATREAVLGAFADLGDGRVERATAALRSVLALQYPIIGERWDGSFPVAAETPAPPHDAVEWVHYDPNWRQFIGCALAMCHLEYGGLLPADVVADIGTALRRCVDGEPEGRIARAYTNPNLMHAWLQGHVGAAEHDVELLRRAHDRLAMLLARFERHGDIDEYNSPTYDGVDLWAIGLWATHPPTDAFADAASTMLASIGARISTLFHPRFGTTCGPYIRAYGLDPTSYVSLSGVLFAVTGEPAERVLPTPLGPETVHVHDLYFASVLDHVAPALRPHLRFAPVTDERRHRQRFGDAVAEHLLRPDLAIGWERGRRHEDSLDQYVPFTAHVAEPDGSMTAFGIMVPPETAWIDVERTGDLTFVVTAHGRADTVGLRIVGTAATAPGSRTAAITIDAPGAEQGEPVDHLRWSGTSAVATVTIAGRR